jgi:predicted phage terminase large subunit-like protein
MLDNQTGSASIQNGVGIEKLIRWNKFIPYLPFPNQLAFLRLNVQEALYGGGTRGGKSIALLMAATQYVDIPSYNAIIFRKTYQELSKGDGLIPVSMDWFKKWENEGVRWDDKLKQWKFPSGAILGFGHLESEQDKFNYIGQSYQFIGFDELTQQPEETYSYLFSRLVRSKAQEKLGIPLRMRSTTNPNGQHVEWVYNKFVNKRTRPAVREGIIQDALKKGMLKEEITEEYIRYRMPMFVPSLARDNPFLDRISYLDSLNKLDPVTRAQLAEGNWEIRAMGNMFNRGWFEKIPYAKVPVIDLKKVRYWDMAATLGGDATACCHLGYDKVTGIFYILDMKILHMAPREIERTLYHCAFDDGAQTSIYMEQEPGSAGIHNIDHFKRKVIPPGWRFYPDRVSGDKETRARPVSSAAEKELIKIAWTRRSDEWYSMVMEQLETFPEADHDDAVDALAGAFNALNQKLNHSARYIGNADWLMPTDKEMDDKTEFGPKGIGAIEDFIKIRTKNQI